jgi:hypothetical protein
MSIANIGNYDYVEPQHYEGRTVAAGKPTVFAARRGKFIPPSRVSEQRRQAVGVGSRDCFYHGAPPLQVKGQFKKDLADKGENVVVPNTDTSGFKTIYQADFEKDHFDVDQFKRSNSHSAAFGKVPMGGFIKFHDVENRAQTGSIPQAKYDMVYTDSHYLGQVGGPPQPPSATIPDMGNIGAGKEAKPEKPKRAAIDFDNLKLLSKARERMGMRTLNFSELPGQDLNPKPMRKGHEEYGERHRNSQITWAYHG